MNKPDIFIGFEQGIPSNIIYDFKENIKTEGLNVIVESRTPTGMMACLEWYMLPAVAVFIGKSYFDGFLKEMGKEHYQSMKEHLSNFTNNVMKTPKIEPTLLGTPGKISTKNPFSSAFSIFADAENELKFKLLIPKHTTEIDYFLITNKFIDFLANYHSGLQTLQSIGYDINESRPTSNIVFVHYSTEKKSIEWLNANEYR